MSHTQAWAHTYKGIHAEAVLYTYSQIVHCTELAVLKGVGSMNFSVTYVGIAIPLFLLPLQICSLPSTTQLAPRSHLTQYCGGESSHSVAIGEVDMYLWHTYHYTRSSSTLYTHTCHTSVEESVCSAPHNRYWHTVHVLHIKVYTCSFKLCTTTNTHTLFLQYTSHLYLWMRCWVSSMCPQSAALSSGCSTPF